MKWLLVKILNFYVQYKIPIFRKIILEFYALPITEKLGCVM